MERSRVVLAFGGGPRDELAVRRLPELTGSDVVTVTLDLGQGRELESVRQRALDAGAVRAHVVDARERLARDVILPALGAGLFAPGGRPQVTELARPVIAAALADVAAMEQSAVVSHGAGGPGRARYARLLRDHAPALRVVPAADHLPSPPDTGDVRENLWGRAVRLPADDAWTEPPPSAYALTVDAARCGATPAVVEIAVEAGEPVAVNGVSMGVAELIEVVGTIAGDHGIGRSDRIGGRAGAREVSESPAAVVLGVALDELERSALDPALVALKAQLSVVYGAYLDEGRWFSPARDALAAFMHSVQARVSGQVRIQLLRGVCRVTGRRLGRSSEAPAVASLV